jgi:hypothetical protein
MGRQKEIAFTSVNGEAYNEIPQQVKREYPFAETAMVTLANDAANSGYIPDDVSSSHKTLQVLGSRLKPGCAGGGIVNTARTSWISHRDSGHPWAPIYSLWFLGFLQRAKTAHADTNAAPEEEERTPGIEGRRCIYWLHSGRQNGNRGLDDERKATRIVTSPS